MAVRTIPITITDTGASPSSAKAGRVGEHNATLLVFSLPHSYTDAGYTYKISINSGMGSNGESETLVPVLIGAGESSYYTISYSLPRSITLNGTADITVNVYEMDGETVNFCIRSVTVHLLFEGNAMPEELISTDYVLLESSDVIALANLATALLDAEAAKATALNSAEIITTQVEEDVAAALATMDENLATFIDVTQAITDANAAAALATEKAWLADAAATAALGLFVDSVANLPETAPDGARATVREITQKSDLSFIAVPGLSPYSITDFLPLIFLKPTISEPNWTALNISPVMLQCAIVFLTFANEYTSPELKYMLTYLPGDTPADDMLLFTNLADGAILYIYFFADNPEYTATVGWNKVLTYTHGDPETWAPISVPPPINNIVTCKFPDAVTWDAAQAYFEDIINPEPFTYRQYIRDGGGWILI